MLDVGGQKALGPDNNLVVGVTLPLDLNGRKEGRVGVAERELDVRRAQLAERERRLRADLRMKASEVLAARRNLGTTAISSKPTGGPSTFFGRGSARGRCLHSTRICRPSRRTGWRPS
jgi:hypothetical protein